MKIKSATFAGSSTSPDKRPARSLPEFAFIGRSNVGKSSLINMLCSNRKLAMTSSTPGKTKVVNHFLINDNWYLVDLPGYGYANVGKKGREAISRVIYDYITLSPDLVCLFVLVDSRHDIGQTDLDFIHDLALHEIPFAIIFTKCDKRGPNVLKAQIDTDCRILSREWEELPPMLASSSETGAGRDEILSYIESILNSL